MKFKNIFQKYDFIIMRPQNDLKLTSDWDYTRLYEPNSAE